MLFEEFKKSFILDKDKIYIYALSEPDDDLEIRYIGKAQNPVQRYKKHLKPSELKGMTHKNNWIKKLLSENKRPNIFLIEIVNDESWTMQEKFWIKTIKDAGFDLTNMAEGGQGGSQGPLPEDRRLALIKFNIGRIVSEETRKRLSESHKGNKASDETKKKMSDARKGRTLSEEQCKKISERQKGIPSSSRGLKMLKNTTSKYVGVSFNKKIKGKRPWRAYITVNNKYIGLGTYETEEEAALAYNEAALKYFGADAKLNIIE